MGYVTVNFSDVESFEPLPEGEYGVEIEKVEVRQNKAKDGLYLNWEMVVIDGDYENRRLWMITSLKDTALFRLKQVFEDLEVIEPDEEEMDIEYDDDVEPSQKEGPALLTPDVEGIECTALVKNEMYDGRERNRVEQLYLERRPKQTTRKTAAASKRSKSTAKSNGRRRDEEEDDDEEEETPRRRSARSSGSTGTRRRRMR